MAEARLDVNQTVEETMDASARRCRASADSVERSDELVAQSAKALARSRVLLERVSRLMAR